MERSIREIYNISNKAQFDVLAMDTFRFQAERCKVYQSYLYLVGTDPKSVNSMEDIPFLPIELFKTHTVYGGQEPAPHIFTSSSTTGMTPAKHHVADIYLYEESFTRAFDLFFGAPEHYAILALLPSYLERPGSSLVYMVDKLMRLSGHAGNGFFLDNHNDLYQNLCILQEQHIPTILFGVAFALLDFIRDHPVCFPELHVIETGGMKGRGIEITRTDLHQRLNRGFGSRHIHSEYGMAELLSQAYAIEGERFKTPPQMRVSVRDLHDPFRIAPYGERGGINIIDLANRFSCSFIETQDLGVAHSDDTFEVLGRIPYSELRGCNVLLEQ